MYEVKVDVSTTLNGQRLKRTLRVPDADSTLHPHEQDLARELVRMHIQRLIDGWSGGMIRGQVVAHVVVQNHLNEPHLYCHINTTADLYPHVRDALFSRAAQESGVEHLLGNHMPA